MPRNKLPKSQNNLFNSDLDKIPWKPRNNPKWRWLFEAPWCDRRAEWFSGNSYSKKELLRTAEEIPKSTAPSIQKEDQSRTRGKDDFGESGHLHGRQFFVNLFW